MKSIVVSIAASSFFTAFAIAQQPSYHITDLGPVGGFPGQPFHITNNGIVAGVAAVSSGAQQATLWFNGRMIDIGKTGLGGPNSVAFGINSSGQTVGEANTSTADPNGEDFCGFKAMGLPSTGTTCLPFLWQSRGMTPLPTLGGYNGAAEAISKQGVVAGFAENNTPDPSCPAPQVLQFKPVIWANGKVHALPTAAGDSEGVAFAINDNGQVAGASGQCSAFNFNIFLPLQSLHALLWQDGERIDLGNLGGDGHGAGITALGLNNQGQVVGESDLAGDASFHAFLWTQSTGMQDLGTLPGDVNSSSVAINDAGDIVGLSLDASFNPRAFLRQNGQMYDLNTLIPANSSLSLLLACSINRQGQIIGLAIDKSSGAAHAYLATPTGYARVAAARPNGAGPAAAIALPRTIR